MAGHVLYGIPASLYSGKARAYLRKQAIAYTERIAGDPRFGSEVVPRIGRFILPVLETPDGALIQDTADIIELLDGEVDPARSAYPKSPVQLVTAQLLEMFGSDGLLRPAMHYRWNFDDANLDFLKSEFIAGLAPTADAQTSAEVFAWASGAMRQVTAEVGVTAQSIPEVERSYGEFLTLFGAHLETTPYLLGGRPTIADFGFIAPLYAHLARDPYPASEMKQRAPRVWRWVERMNSPNLDTGEYPDCPRDLFPDDGIPETLRALLTYIAEEYVSEIAAQVEFIDRWLDGNEVSEGQVIPYELTERFIGTVSFDWRGQELEVGVLPYRTHRLQHLQDVFRSTHADAQATIRAMFREHGLEPLLDLGPRRRIERRDNREVWGPTREPSLPGS